jgi:hypothetical protein
MFELESNSEELSMSICRPVWPTSEPPLGVFNEYAP